MRIIMSQVKPFIKWVGGKQRLVKYINPPINRFNYVEPFIGGGSVMLHILQNYDVQKCLINDLNPDIYSMWGIVKNDSNRLIKHLKNLLNSFYETDDRSEFYYTYRDIYNNSKDVFERVVLLIFLNKSCFRGLYRINSKGKFNTSFGRTEKVKINFEAIKQCSELLNTYDVEITNFDFYDTLELINTSEPTFVYFDPPYYGAFNQYYKDKFNLADWQQLLNYCNYLNEFENVYFCVSSSDVDEIKDMFSDYNQSIVNVFQSMDNKNTNELFITNY